jgi:hypothetical protein
MYASFSVPTVLRAEQRQFDSFSMTISLELANRIVRASIDRPSRHCFCT